MFDILNRILNTEQRITQTQTGVKYYLTIVKNILKHMNNTPKTSAPAVDKSVAILDFVSACEQPPSAADITRELLLPRSSAHGLITTLVTHGLLHKNTESRYTISGRVMQWANGFLTQQNVVPLFNTEIASRPALSAYSLTLTCRDGRDVVCLACHNGNSRLGFTFHMGLRLPVGFAATGKAILSTESDIDVKKLLGENWHTPLTPHSTKNCQALLEELAQTRTRGYSIDDRQIRDGMYCIGVPVFDHSQTARYGIALSMQKADANPTLIEQLGKTLRQSADELSQRLGAELP